MTYTHKLLKRCSATLSFTLVGCWQYLDLIYVAADQVEAEEVIDSQEALSRRALIFHFR